MTDELYDIGDAQFADLVIFDGNSIKKEGRTEFVEMLPGSHKVVIESTWSNKFVDSNDYNFIAEAGKKYVIGLYELAKGQDPATADFHERSVAYKFGRDTLHDPAATPLLPLIIFFGWPLLLLFALQREQPRQSRPFDGCCFVWIQDEETAEVVAGTRP